MLAAVIERPGAVAVREVPAPQAAGLALVRVGVAGICGTDRKLAAGVFPVTGPRVLGHEMTGWVEAPGPGGAVPAGTGATVIMFGTVRAADGLPAYEAYLRELTIRCPRASRPRDFDTAIRLCAERRLDVAPLVTGRFRLPDAAQALAASEDPAQLKILLDVAGR